MDRQEFRELIESMGAKLDSDGRYAILMNVYGEFRVDIETSEVYYKPTQCSYCETPCTEYKKLCLLPQGVGWSNFSLTERQLLTLAKLNLLQNGWIPLELERQLPNDCVKGVEASYGPDLHKIHQYWRSQPHWASTPEVNEQIATNYLELLCTVFRVPALIRNQADLLYKQAEKSPQLGKYCIEALITAIFYLVCKRARMPLTLEGLTYAPLLQKDIWMCYPQILTIKK